MLRIARRGEIREPIALMRTIAHRLLVNAYVAAKKRPRDLSWEALIGPDGSGLDHLPQFQVHDFEDAEFTDHFDRAVRDLDPDLRDAFILGELRGLTSREAGPHLGVSRTTANARRELAAARVREEITHVR